MKNLGVMMQIRQAKVSDAAALLRLFNQLDSETKFMLFEPNERTTTLEQQTEILKSFVQESDNQPPKVMFVIEEKDSSQRDPNKNDTAKLLGFVVGLGNATRRNRHSLYCVMGIVQAATGQGLGYQLLEQLQDWAEAHGITRLELSVMTHNERAKRLYEKFGFEVEGIKLQAMQIEGQLIDEFIMAKLLL